MAERKKPTKWTIDSYSDHVWQMYQRTIYVIPGQVWGGAMTKLWHYCSNHGAYEAKPNNVLRPKNSSHPGPQCQGCLNDATAARNYQKTIDFIGQTTSDGHLILEHVGYHRTPSDKKLGRQGKAKYRYRCGRCGNEHAVATGNNLKNPGHNPGCSECHKKRESIQRHLKQKAYALSPCRFYLATVHYDDYIKIGISKDYEKRAAAGNKGNPYYDKDLTPEEFYHAGGIDLSYEDTLFLSEEYPRAWIFAIEQILLKQTKQWCPIEPLPKEMIEILWSGQSELRSWLMPYKPIISAFHALIKEIEDSGGDWYKVYSKHIVRDRLMVV